MTKAQFTKLLAQKSGLSVPYAARILNAFLDSVEDALFRDGRVALKGLGSFDIRQIGSRQARHPVTGRAVQTAPFRTVRFRAERGLLVNLN